MTRRARLLTGLLAIAAAGGAYVWVTHAPAPHAATPAATASAAPVGVGALGRVEGIDESLADAQHVGREVLHALGRERLRHEATEPGVHRRVGGEHGRRARPALRHDLAHLEHHVLGWDRLRRPELRGERVPVGEDLGDEVEAGDGVHALVTAAEIVRRLLPLAPLGPRMTPPDRLLALARTGGRFTTD